MERFTNNRIFAWLLYLIMGLAALYLLLLVKPVFLHIYVFLRAVLAPFLIAMIISYVLNPIVSLLNERKVPRTMAVLLIYAVFLAGLTVILMNAIPMFIDQLQELNRHMPDLSMKAQNIVDGLNNSSFLPESFRSGINKSLYKLEKQGSDAIFSFINNIGAMLNVVFIAFIIPFLAFYILKDFEVFERTLLTYVPKPHRKHAVRLLKDIDNALGSYIRGQFIVCVIVGTLAYIGYLIIGMPYPLLLASVVAVTNIIPYLGPFFGAAPALVMASTVSLKMMLMVVIVNSVCQILEGNVVSPQVVGRTLHMHPLSIIFALLVGGELAGIVGMILAVPIFAALKVIVQHIFAYYVRRKTI
ncbi:AI-2E family transporter [Paenibacillus sacheonensis]|uniref:AI-2E family transporter n=1 Tax=Paenibacillus sacheonensis TaxID=742054 RepID=A0A7X5BV06_9BACL|nr:AI-2E family transporter [Paenibacillus sacheonensis]MBM7563721.1 putative PurR-regulated permease PerM [Paenibacillus sacheonensis]NBC67923.1 AI-2E family transporter [Paenibacillus sacheonensis]